MLKNKSKLIPLMMTMAFTLVLFLSTAITVLANEVQVYLDGNLLTYTEAPPTIINDRTMVPLTETANHFGMANRWDSDTGTMYFTKGDRTMQHTVYSNVIYVNGLAQEFDMTSTVVNDRTLMPVRMLAEAIDAKVDWDGTFGRVLIVSNPSSSTGGNNNNFNTPAPTATPTPVLNIQDFKLDSKTVAEGEKVKATIETNYAVTKVKIEDKDENELGSSSNPTDIGDGYRFTIEFTPKKTGDMDIYAYVSNANGYDEDIFKKATLTVESKKSEAKITSVVLDKNEVGRSDTVKVTIKTSADVKSIAIYDEDDKSVASKSSRTTGSSSSSTWSLSFKAPSSTGTYRYTVVATDENKDTVDKTFDVKVVSSSSSSGSGSISVTDYDLDPDRSTYYKGDRVWIEITLDGEPYRVSIKDDVGSGTLDSQNSGFSYKSNNKYTAHLEFTVNDEDTKIKYTITVEDDNGKETTETFTINVD